MLELTAAPTVPKTRPDPVPPVPLLSRLMLNRHENWARWVLRHWSEVAVLDGVESLEWIAGRPRLHAEVCLTLGTLQPADVRVELVPAEPLPDGHPLWHGRAMLSVACLQNGRCWFAVNAAADPDDAVRTWKVRVRPLRPLTGTADVSPLEYELEPVPAGTPRRRVRHSGAA